jgi:SAM-dependent methyltransferase
MFKLIRLGLRRRKSPEHYRELQRYIAQASVDELQIRGVRWAESHVLELGAGYGGYSAVFVQLAKSFTACDFRAHEFFSGKGIPFCVTDVSKPLPFAARSIDLVYASSLIEHIAEPNKLLIEIWRVLKPGGKLYLSFPPFYSLTLVGGHNFKPFHLFGEKRAIAIVNRLRKKDFKNYATCYKTWGLYPLKIETVKQLILGANFEILDMYTRLSPLNTTRLPGILKDLATWHVCYLAQKPFV